MEREQIMAMDANILLSIINMKLRDAFSNLEALCEDYNISIDEIKLKLEAAGYIYNQDSNQFIRNK